MHKKKRSEWIGKHEWTRGRNKHAFYAVFSTDDITRTGWAGYSHRPNDKICARQLFEKRLRSFLFTWACAILFDDSMTIRNTFIYKFGIYFKWKKMTKHESNTQNKRCQLYYREYWKETTRVLCNKTCWIVESSYWRIRELFLLDRQLTAFFFFLGLLLAKANVYTVQFVGCLV